MTRIVVTIVLFLFSLGISAQEVEIRKSTDIIVLRGKSYYLHTVQAGETLFSICRVYGVEVDEVCALNDKKDTALSLYEVLKIPFVETSVNQDSKYFFHKAKKGETIYSIARLYMIKPKRLLKHNVEYAHNEPLPVGAVIRLPLDEIDPTVVKSMEEETVPAARSTGKELPENEEPETDGAGTGIWNAEKDNITTPPVRDTLHAGNQPGVAEMDSISLPDYTPESPLHSGSFVTVAVMLPLTDREYPHYTDTLVKNQTVSLSSRSKQFIGFYEGILLSVDSLKNLGYKIDLHVYDTEGNSRKTAALADEIGRLNPDLIIGPVYAPVYKTFVSSLNRNNIPVVYPLSSKTENLGIYPNFIQVNNTTEVLAEEMFSWLMKQLPTANIVYIDSDGGDEEDMKWKNEFRERLRNTGNIKFFHRNTDMISLGLLRKLLLPERENILVLPESREAEVSKILPLMSALADGYTVTVLGLPEWQTFASVDHEAYYKLNTKLFTYNYVDYTSEAAKVLSENYRRYFHTEPGILVYRAFDMGIYFIELAAKYRNRTLEALENADIKTGTSSFRFRKMKNGMGMENTGTFIVNYNNLYQLKIENWK